MMKSHKVPLLVLALLSPFFTELLVGNMSASTFFLPQNLFFLFIFYSLPIIVIRELSVKYRLGLIGLFLLGLAYGIYNEGICAKTLFLGEHVPIQLFDGYLTYGINIPWSICILVWHALHSVIFPITFVHYCFPDRAKERWLSTRKSVIFSVIFMFFGCGMFLGNQQRMAPPVYLLLCLGAIGGLVLLSRKFSYDSLVEAMDKKITVFPAVFGFMFYLIFVAGLSIFAGLKLPILFLLIYACAVLFLSYQFLKRRGWLHLPFFVLFILGDYLAASSFSCLVGFTSGSLERLVVALIYNALLIALIILIRFNHKKRI